MAVKETFEGHKALFALSHPAHPGWNARGFDDLPDVAEDSLRDRYAGTRDIDFIISAVKQATMADTITRDALEKENLVLLNLNNEQYEEYRKHVGRLGSAARFVRWFAERSNEAFVRSDNALISGTSIDPRKISLEFGGNRQYGLWNHHETDFHVTKETDDIVWQLYGQLEELQDEDSRVNFHWFQYEGGTPIRYRLSPVYTGERDIEHIKAFNISRWRAICDVELDGQVVRVTKQSKGLILADGMQDKDKKRIFSIYKDPAQKSRIDKSKTTDADRIGANIFRDAIIHHDSQYHYDRERASRVIPIAANIIIAASPSYKLWNFEK